MKAAEAMHVLEKAWARFLNHRLKRTPLDQARIEILKTGFWAGAQAAISLVFTPFFSAHGQELDARRLGDWIIHIALEAGMIEIEPIDAPEEKPQ